MKKGLLYPAKIFHFKRFKRDDQYIEIDHMIYRLDFSMYDGIEIS